MYKDTDKIIATGKLFGNICTVTATMDNQTLQLHCDKIASSVLKMHMQSCLITAEPMGGTFYPDGNTLLAAYHVFTTNFFESLSEVQVCGNIGTIPWKQGIVY